MAVKTFSSPVKTPITKLPDSLQQLINTTNEKAIFFKNKNWDAWCSNYLKAYNKFYDADNIKNECPERITLLDSICTYAAKYNTDTLKKTLQLALYYRGCDHVIFDHTEPAKEDLAAALALYYQLQLQNYNREIFILNELATLYNKSGNLKQCLQFREKQYAVSEKNNDFKNIIITILNASIVVQQVYGIDSSVNLLKKGLQYSQQLINDGTNQGKLYANLSSCYFENGNTAAALTNANKAIYLLNKSDDEYAIRYKLDAMDVLAQLHAKNGNTDTAITLTKKIIAQRIKIETTERERTIGKNYLSLAGLYKQAGKPAAQITAINKALYAVSNIDTTVLLSLPSIKELYAENTIMEALDAKAIWMMENAPLKKPETYFVCAVQCYEASFKVEDLLMNDYDNDESKLLQLKESRLRSEMAIAACIKLSQLTLSKQWAEKAFLFAEQNKARVLQDNIKRNLLGNTQFANDTLYQQLKKLTAEEHNLETNIYNQQLAPTADPAQLSALQIQLTQVRQARFNTNVYLKQTNPQYSKMLAQKDSLQTSDIFKHLLTANTDLIEYFTGDSAIYVFHLQAKNQSVLIYTLPLSILQLTDKYLLWFDAATAIENNPAAFLQDAFALNQSLIAPLLNSTQSERLIIIPDGKLSRIPFESLVEQAPTGTNLTNAPYLIKKFQIFYGYSTKVLLQQVSQKQHSGTLDIAMAPISVFAPNLQVAALNNTVAEMEAFKMALRNAIVYTYSNASLPVFKNKSSSAHILHIATHAVAYGKQPYIIFSDSLLYMQQLYGMQIPAQLVVLSACKTSVGEQQQGEGTMSLARAFSYAGAQNVITSFWEVNDKSTADFMQLFYTGLQEKGPGTVLHQTKIKWLELSAGKSQLASPYYWAAFVNYGYTPHQSHNNTFTIILISISIAFLATAFILLVKKSRSVS